MRRASHFNQWLIGVAIVQGEPFVDVVIGVLGIGCREIEDRKANLAAHTCCAHLFNNGLVEKIHVGKASGSRFNHFCHGQVGAVADKAIVYKAALSWPDMIMQPGY